MSPIKSRKHPIRRNLPATAPGLLTTALLGGLAMASAHATTPADAAFAGGPLIAQAFQCKAGDAMVRPADKQVKIW